MAAPGKFLSMRRQLLGRILFVSQTLPKQQKGRKEEVESNYGTELDPAQLTAAQDHRCCTHNLYINKSLVPLKPLTRCQQLFCSVDIISTYLHLFTVFTRVSESALGVGTVLWSAGRRPTHPPHPRPAAPQRSAAFCNVAFAKYPCSFLPAFSTEK